MILEGYGWFIEKRFRKTWFKIQFSVDGEKIEGKIFDEINPDGTRMPEAAITGTLKDGKLIFTKNYNGHISASIEYFLKKPLLSSTRFWGNFRTYACIPYDFNCMTLLGKGATSIKFKKT